MTTAISLADGARYPGDSKLTIFTGWVASDEYVWRSLKTTNGQTAIEAGRASFSEEQEGL